MRRNRKWGVMELRYGYGVFSPQVICMCISMEEVSHEGWEHETVVGPLVVTVLSRARSLGSSGFDTNECENGTLQNTHAFVPQVRDVLQKHSRCFFHKP